MGKTFVVMCILAYWIVLVALFVTDGSPFQSEGFTFSSNMNSSAISPPTIILTPTFLDQLYFIFSYIVFLFAVGGSILLFLILGVGLPLDYPTWVLLGFGLWQFFIFMLGVTIVIGIFTGD